MSQKYEIWWEGVFPYDFLDEAGVTPRSSTVEVRGARLHFIRNNRSQLTKALDVISLLEVPNTRLFVDFFLDRAGPDAGE